MDFAKKIRVCFVQGHGYSCFNPHSSAKIGGAEVDFYYISTELARDNRFDIYFLTRDFGQKDLEVRENVKILKSYTGDKTFFNFLSSLLKFYIKLSQINAHVYVTSTYSKEIGLVGLFCKIFNKKHIHRTAHDLEFDRTFIFRNIRKGRITALSYLIGTFTAKLYIVQNDEHQSRLRLLRGQSSIVIKNSHRIPSRTSYNKKDILWVARGESWKRPELFIELAESFQDYKFKIIMTKGSDPGLFEEIQKKANTLTNLEFIPGLPFSEIDEPFKNAKIFVNTSLHEGFPHVFNLAMKHFTPILSLNVNPDDFLNKYHVGFCSNNDFKNLKENLTLLLNNMQMWENLSENAYKYVKLEMNLEKNINLWKISLLNLFRKKS